MQHIIVFLCPADAGGLHPHRGCEISGTKAHRGHARGTRGDLLDMGDASGGFYDHLKADALAAALGGLNRRHQRIDGIDVSGAAHLGDHDLVNPVARLFQHVDHVFVPIGGVEAVDAHREVFRVPVHIVDGLNDIGARRVLVRG